MTHLRALELRRFRSHASLALSLDERSVAIHGPNGAGKTNILEAVSLLSPGRGLRGAKAEELAARPDPIGWAVAARLRADNYAEDTRVQVSVDLRQTAKRVISVDDATENQLALGRLSSALWLTPAMDRLWIEGASERRRFLDRLTLAFDPAHAERSAAYEKAMRERNRLLKEGHFEPAWLCALEAQMATAGAGIIRARSATIEALIEAQSGAKTLFPKAQIAILQSSEVEENGAASHRDETGLAEALERGRRRDAAAGRTLSGPHRDDLNAIYAEKAIEARHCSTGEQKALLISLVLAAARALEARHGRTPLLLLDEVAAHLDEARRAALYDEICAIGAQAWMTGTGPELFEALGDRAQWVALSASGQIVPDGPRAAE